MTALTHKGERHLECEAPSACSVAAGRELLLSDPSAVFAPHRRPGIERRTFPTTLRFSGGAGATTMHAVTAALGIPDTASGARFPLSWAPTSHRRTLPAFHGVLELVPDGDECRVRIEGSYEAPLGAPGRVFDAVAGQRVARQSIEDLAAYVAVRLAECSAAREEAEGWHPPTAPESLRDRPPPDSWLDRRWPSREHTRRPAGA